MTTDAPAATSLSPHAPAPQSLTPEMLTPELLRAWAWHRQGLDGTLQGADAAEVLTRAGWARSVGGANRTSPSLPAPESAVRRRTPPSSH
jgi:hypothetical protein